MRPIFCLFVSIFITSSLIAANNPAVIDKIFTTVERKNRKALLTILDTIENSDNGCDSENGYIVDSINPYPNTRISQVGLTPLLYAIKLNREDMVYLLLSRGADPNIAEDRDFQDQRMDNHLFVLEQSGITFASPGWRDDRYARGDKALHFATKSGNTNIISLLLSYRANPNSIGRMDSTPLFIAVENGDQKSIKLLLFCGLADPNISCRGETPLILAIKKSLSESVIDLLECGADVNMQNDDGLTPIICAAGMRSKETKEIIETLLLNGADGDYGKERVETYESRVRQVFSGCDLYEHLLNKSAPRSMDEPNYPPEIWEMIRQFLDAKDLIALSLVNKFFFASNFSNNLPDLKLRLTKLPTYKLLDFLVNFAPEHLPKLLTANSEHHLTF